MEEEIPEGVEGVELWQSLISHAGELKLDSVFFLLAFSLVGVYFLGRNRKEEGKAHAGVDSRGRAACRRGKEAK